MPGSRIVLSSLFLSRIPKVYIITKGFSTLVANFSIVVRVTNTTKGVSFVPKPEVLIERLSQVVIVPEPCTMCCTKIIASVES